MLLPFDAGRATLRAMRTALIYLVLALATGCERENLVCRVELSA